MRFALGAGPLTALGLAAAGIAPGVARVRPPGRGAHRIPGADVRRWRDFFADNWYLDRLYAATFMRAAGALSRAARWNDQVVWTAPADGLGAAAVGGGRLLALLQSGYVQMYLSVALAVMAALAAWLLGARGVMP